MWSLNSVITSNAVIFPHSFGAEDYRFMLIYFKEADLARRSVPICRLSTRRLTYNYTSIVSNYNQKEVELFRFYNMQQKLDLINDRQNLMDSISRAVALDRVDQKVIQLLLNTKKRYLKLRTGKVDHSPIVSQEAHVQYMWRTELKVEKSLLTFLPELMRISRKTSIDAGDLTNEEFIQMKVEFIRSEYLKLKAAHLSYRKQHLHVINQKCQQHQEMRKKKYERYTNTFSKSKMKVIEKVEFRYGSDLTWVSTKEEVELEIMKDNIGRFKLAYSSLLLEGKLLEQLGISG